MNVAIDFQRLLPAWLELQSVATIAHIESESNYERTTELLNGLLDIVRDDATHPFFSLLAVVGDLIEAYEIDSDSFRHEEGSETFREKSYG
ncbi:MAG: hypothetical protein K9K38_01620 [Rhodoferax sp.]|nr:hypothetical protein [Rhodoferax sp.]MCF8208094.1 hypothetical protein [Rhodoferax sp.]